MAIPPAIGLIEFNSIARGMIACDEMLKAATVDLIEATPVCPGKYIVLIGGEVAAVETSVRTGQRIGAETVVDDLIIPNVHPQIFPAIVGTTSIEEVEALGIIETFSVASTIIAGDAAAKAANVSLIEIRLAKGLGGKSFLVLTGTVADVRAGIQAGVSEITDRGMILDSVVIPSPNPSLIAKVL